MGVGMGLNLALLVAMVATNILSLYHLSSTRNPSSSTQQIHAAVPDRLVQQLHTIRATIAHLTRLRSSSTSAAADPPSDLLLFSRLAPIASACSDHPDLLHRYMNYTPFALCPPSSSLLVEPLLLRGCHPLPRRRCFSPSPKPISSSAAHDADESRLLSAHSALDLTIPQLLAIAKASASAPIRLALDVGGGAGSLAVQMRNRAAATVVTTTLDLGRPNSLSAAARGVVPLQSPLQQRFPVPDGSLDLVRTGHAVNRWIPVPALEFLFYDADRVVRAGGLLWVDHFFCRASDLPAVYAPMIGRLGYKRIKWAVGNKTDSSGLKYGEVYLTALLQKPVPATAAAA